MRPSGPSCSTVWALLASTGMVAAFSGSPGNARETEGSSSREPLSFIDWMGRVDSAAVASAASVPGWTAADWRRQKEGGGHETKLSGF